MMKMRSQESVVLLLFGVLYLYPVVVRSILLNSTDWSDKFKEYVDNQVSIKFMPGTYEVEDDILITKVSNFSIEGDRSSGGYITFNCSNASSWIIANSLFVKIKNVRFLNCGNMHETQVFKGTIPSEIKAAIFIYNVSSISIVNITIGNSCGYGIIALNIVGMCTFEHLIIHGNDTLSTFCDRLSNNTLFGGMVLLNLRINDDITLQEDTVININKSVFFDIQATWQNKTTNAIKYFNSSIIGLVLYQAEYHIYVNIENVNITNINNTERSIISISYSKNSTTNVVIANTLITCTNANYSIVEINYEGPFNATNMTLSKSRHKFCLTSCKFYHNKAKYVFRIKDIYNDSMSMLLKNNVFENNTVRETLFNTKAVVPLISGYLNFSSNKANIVFSMTNYVLLDDGAVFSFINNSYDPQYKFIYRYLVRKKDMSSQECPFQFRNSKSVSIIFQANEGFHRTIYGNPLFGCSWIQNSERWLPSEIYSRVIKHDGVQGKGISGWENSVCPCDGSANYDHACLGTKEHYVYPGETITIGLKHYYFDIAMYTDFNESKFNAIAPSCGIHRMNLKIDLVFNYCTTVKYTIASNSNSCLLLLKTATKENTPYAFRVNLKECSVGFILDNKDGICKCDPKFVSSLSGLECDISNQAFQQPPDSWIGYDGSDIIFAKSCRQDYCLRNQGVVQLSNPDSQCLSGRSGIACGECAQGLSTVFGASRCKKCTSYWLFLLPVFAIAGFLLVLVLFVFNLTVVDGDIYGFILMVNTLSIHSNKIFPTTKDAPWVLVSLFNLDLGIEVCLYDGMTAYAATWLRFMFPVYVLLIVAAMAFASRYFHAIEKITRKRVIPVIATLYLLSYNKIMQVTFLGLFSYTTVYHLYAENRTLYWGMDSNVSLFGLRFSILFIFCSIIFLFLIIPTNVLLISGKTVYRFKIVVTHLKPFLDAYEAPFKENCRYILGLELLLRAIVFAITSFSVRNTAAIYSAIFLIYTVYICQVMPFKNRFNFILYSLYLVYMSGFVILFTRFYPCMQKTYEVLFNLIFYLGFVQFLGIIAIHIWKYKLCNYPLLVKCEKFMKKTFQLNIFQNSYNCPMDSAALSPGRYEHFQEELLALETDA